MLRWQWTASNKAAARAQTGFSVSLMHKTIVIQSSSDIARKLCRDIVGQISTNSFSQEEIFSIHMAIEEAMVNAVEHGNRLDSSKNVTIEYSITSDTFEISVADEGCGFIPDAVPDPRKDENVHNVTGRGILLMRAFMDSVEYNERGNWVHMVKYRIGSNRKA
jgi:serine/threonine-protein kinase RsbW